MLKITQAIVVEGKYDKIKLSSILDAVIVVTNGYGVFKDKEKLAIIRYYAKTSGIIIATDSDSAGFIIRNFLKGAIVGGKITNVYIPDILGKEKRKTAPSKEGKLGVEGIEAGILLDAFKKSGVFLQENDGSISENLQKITKMDLYEDGFSGGKDSSAKRQVLLRKLRLPELLTTGSMLEILNTMLNFNEYKKLVATLAAELLESGSQ